jgi:hypothetical protein
VINIHIVQLGTIANQDNSTHYNIPGFFNMAILGVEVKKLVGKAIDKKDDQRYSRGIKLETFMQIALYQCDDGALKTAARTVYPG